MNRKNEVELIQLMRRKAKERLPDDLNPEFLFSKTHIDLLLQIAQGTLRTKKIARKELENRGLNNDGLFIGVEFDR